MSRIFLFDSFMDLLEQIFVQVSKNIKTYKSLASDTISVARRSDR